MSCAIALADREVYEKRTDRGNHELGRLLIKQLVASLITCAASNVYSESQWMPVLNNCKVVYVDKNNLLTY